MTETLRGGGSWSRRMRRGQSLRITDITGKGAVAALFYNADAPLERYNMADTLKAQYTAFLTAGRVLYSDMGRILASIVEDTCGWHDTLSGCGNAATTRARYGEGRYQELRNDFYRNTRDNFLVELGKHGLGKKDIVPNVNFFVRIRVDESGRLAWARTSTPATAGSHVDLRFEMNTLVVLSNTPHPLDPSPSYKPAPIELISGEARAPGPDDPCRVSRPENGRGFALTEAYLREMMP
jgi:urea carboxylase-associated protein 2